MSDKILYVDDEPNILASCQRSLGRRFNITTASSGAEGIEIIRTDGPFAVVLSDMRMPGMDGIEFIRAAREVTRDTVCMMLTGNADQETAMNAVNQGNIFRFLTKPCPQEVLVAALEAGIRQYRLITAEKELLQKTLTGSIKTLVDVLELVNPMAFTRGGHIKPIVKAIVADLKLKNPWQYEIAALLSQLGCIVLPPEIVEKVFSRTKLSSKEQEMYDSHPINGAKLLENIPRLEGCARMIERQLDRYDASDTPDPDGPDGVVILGSQILHAAIGFDSHLSEGLGRHVALAKMKAEEGEYNPDLLNVLKTASIPEVDDAPKGTMKEVSVRNLTTRMYAHEDILTSTGTLLVPRGNEITQPLIERLKNFADGAGIKEPICVLVPDQRLASAA